MLNALLQELKNHPSLEQQPIFIFGSEDSSTHYAISQALPILSNSAQVIVIAPDDKRAQEVYEDLTCFVDADSVAHFPSRKMHHEISISVNDDYSRTRVTVLADLLLKRKKVVIASLQALRMTTVPPATLESFLFSLANGDEIDLTALSSRLVNLGYERVSLVFEPGQFAVRGGIIDLFSPYHQLPVRIECFGTIIESIRLFQPDTQRSAKSLESMVVAPSTEVIYDHDDIKQVLRRLKDFCDRENIPKSRRDLYQDWLATNPFGHFLEDILPVVHGCNSTLLDYLEDHRNVVWINRTQSFIEQQTINARLESFQKEPDDSDKIVSPDLLVPQDEIARAFNQKPNLIFEDLGDEQSNREIQLDFKNTNFSEGNAIGHIRGLAKAGYKIRIFCYSEVQKTRLAKIFTNEGKREEEGIKIAVGLLQHGFQSDAEQLLIMPDREIFGITKKRRAVQPKASDLNILKEIDRFPINSYIVHIDHGIGIYRGMKHLTVAGAETDFAELEYLDGDKLYLPVYRLNLIEPYSVSQGDDSENAIDLDKLGSQRWTKAKKQARKAVAEMARELLKLYATRKIVTRQEYSEPGVEYNQFEAAFPFTETHDQMNAINSVMSDMDTTRPMDRLICGDVGFGKTEVALRAAFRAILSSKQVAVLVPTTLLAEQHYRTFSERMVDFPVNIGRLSRFQTTKQQRETIANLEAGQLDVVIGTHRLLSKDVTFNNLGLLIIDEEHRFGVKHKSKISSLRTKVDIITLTATPIPRTLQMSLYGFRDLSVIETPPSDRQAIHTYIAPFNDKLIIRTIGEELKREGQVFFVHNRVQTIEAIAGYLKKLLPELRFGIVHGSKNETAVEKVMKQFLNQEIDLLLATTIIESGLDFPNANTILINRADRFGLAQLYQLRGRVGRSDREAYAYLLVPGEDLISAKAQKRLRALKSFTTLGSGYRIALRDLEIRGAGNILGTKQSGHIRSIGIDLYLEMLDKAVRELKGEGVEEVGEPDLQLQGSAYIPANYIQEEALRFNMYRKLSCLENEEELHEIVQELTDRFGPPPTQLEHLFDVVRLRLLAKKLGIAKIRIGKDTATISFIDAAPIEPAKLIALLTDKSKGLKMLNANALQIISSGDHKEMSVTRIKNILQQLH